MRQDKGSSSKSLVHLSSDAHDLKNLEAGLQSHLKTSALVHMI